MGRKKNQNFLGLPYTFLWLSVFILNFKLEMDIGHNLFSALEPVVVLTGVGRT